MMTSLVPLTELPPNRRTWPLVLPAAMLVLVAGFSGRLTWVHAVMLLALGGSFLLVWLDRSPAEPAAANAGPVPPVPETGSDTRRLLQLLLAIALAGLGAWAAVRATVSGGESRGMSPGLVGATVLSPLLMLPTLGTTTALAQRGHTGPAVTALVGTVLLNLCALVPAVVLLGYLSSAYSHRAEAGSLLELFQKYAQPTPYPLLVWRVDTVLLAVLGFAMIPVAIGRWLPGRFEAILLVFVYIAYFVATALSNRSG